MKLNRKWLLAIALVLSMTMAVSGTLAYLTDRDSEANVFTMGNVEIELTEKFEQGATLIPGVDINKDVQIKNTGKNEAWVWYTYAVPTNLVDTGNNASKNAIHFNLDPAYWDTYASEEQKATGKTWHWEAIEHNVTIDDSGIEYTVVTMLYNAPLAVDETTPVSLTNVYLDTRVDITPEGDMYWVENGEATTLNWNINDNGAPVIYVSAYAMQKEEFDTVNAAYDAYNKQWGNNGTEYDDPSKPDVTVANNAELAAAIEAGTTEIGLEAGTYQIPAAAKGKTLRLVGIGADADEVTIEVVPAGQGEANGQLDYSLDGSTVTFENLTIKTNSQTYAGYARLSGTYNNCVIQNTYNLGTGNSAFNNCTFNITNEYLRVGGAYSAAFNECTFNTNGRAILVFQDGTSVDQTVTVKDCTFNASAAANTWNGIHVAAVSIDGSQGGTYVVNLEGTNTVDSDFNGLWQIKAGETNVTVNE